MEPAVDLFTRSIEIIKQNQMPNGAYIASPNFPTYHYSWFRDGSYIAHAMDRAGEHDSARRFFDWTVWAIGQRTESTERAIAAGMSGREPEHSDLLDTRYTVDGKPGEMEWFNNQLDGFGTLLWAMGRHCALTGEARPEWMSVIDLLARYLSALWPFPCSDCWEEFPDKIHIASLAAIFGGLNSAAELLGRTNYSREADRVRAFVRANGVHNGALVKFVGTDWVDASLVHVATPYRLLEVTDPIMVATIDRLESELMIHGGGIHRYVLDNYYGGGEWILLTAYLAWYHVESGNQERAEELLRWIEAAADDDGELPEQVEANLIFPDMLPVWLEKWGPPARPLVWSHAAYVTLVDVLSHPMN